MRFDAKTNQHGLPESFKPLLWSYDFDKIKPDECKKEVIIAAVNYGALEHLRWVIHHYGSSTVRNILSSIPETELRPASRRLASLLFSITQFNHAPRGPH
jgi:hypothetical protein